MNTPLRLILALVVVGALVFGLRRLQAGRAAEEPGALRASGTVEAVELSIAAEVGGRIQAIAAEEGDEVTAGQVLVRLDGSLAEAQREQAAAAVALAELAPAGPQAAAALRAAEAGLALAEAQLARLTVTAPADGVVLARLAQPGEVAAPGAPLLTLGLLDDLTITVFVPGDRYGAIDLGDRADLTVDALPERSFSAEVVHIADRAEFTPRNVQTAAGRAATVYAVRLAVTNKAGRLKPGMPADVVFDDE